MPLVLVLITFFSFLNLALSKVIIFKPGDIIYQIETSPRVFVDMDVIGGEETLYLREVQFIDKDGFIKFTDSDEWVNAREEKLVLAVLKYKNLQIGDTVSISYSPLITQTLTAVVQGLSADGHVVLESGVVTRYDRISSIPSINCSKEILKNFLLSD